MLKIKRILSKKGFTLVEVIVAVVILGVTSLGIFQSYKVGFWGMSDARARTIATNIAQEKLEEIKGKSLDAGTYPDPDNPIVVSGKDFNAVVKVEIVVEDGQPTTLRKIIATVSWQKRNGEETNISVESLQSTALAPPSEDVPTAILVSANPTSINVGKTSAIKVTILDQDNYPISYIGRIDLSMDPDTLGTLDVDFLNFNGDSYLSTTFRANAIGDAGDVQIKAEDHLDSDELIDDSDTITIIGGEAAKINLMVDPVSILINGKTSTLTVRIEDANGYLADNWTGTIQLAITSGQNTGDLGDSPGVDTIFINFVDENIKTTLFTSSSQNGEAVIEATDQAEVLLSEEEATETIYVTSGPPYQIDIKAEPKSIFIQGYEGGPTSTSSVITVTIKNATGVPVSGFVGMITLSLLSGSESGSLATNTLIFNGQSSLSTTFTSTVTPGIVEIKAQDTTSGGAGYVPLIPDTETLTVAASPPDHLEIVATPDIILNNGIDSSTLTIGLKDFYGNYSSFDEDKTLIFSLSPNEGTANNNTSLTLPAGYSQISTTYVCANSGFEGKVGITVNCDNCEGIAEGRTTVQVASRIIRPAEEPNIQYGQKRVWRWGRWVSVEDKSKVLFDIEVLGGIIGITQIDLAWKEGTTLERLQGITIFVKDDPSNIKIGRTWTSNYPLVLIYPNFCVINSGFSPHQDLVVGTYTIELDYNQDILGRTIIIQFHGTYLNKDNIYQLEFLSPDLVV
jgi:prepilin-type N-terminal cleavage/methylation domain-containing protein